MILDAWEEARKRHQEDQRANRFESYQFDPARFMSEVLRENFYDDLVEVMESVRDNPITIARSSNAPGKTYLAARIAIYFYLVYPQSQIYVTAAPPAENLHNILWGQILSAYHGNPDLFDGHRSKTLRIYRNSVSFITGVSIPLQGTKEERESKFAGKHAPQLLFIVDEGDAVPEEVYKGIEGCMSGGLARLLIMFNPRGQRGRVFDMEHNKQAKVIELSALRHPNVLTGKNIIPGAVTRETTVRRINEWTRPISPEEDPLTKDTFDVPDYLVGSIASTQAGVSYPPLPPGKRVIEMPEFSYMVLGKYPSQAVNQLIAEEWINAALARWKSYVALHGERPPEGVQPRHGVDVAEFGVDMNVSILRYGGWVPKPIRWSGVDPTVTAERAMDTHFRHNCYLTYVDGTGYGSSVAPTMVKMARLRERICRAITVKVADKPSPMIKVEFGEFYQLRDQLWWAVREWLRTDPTAMLPPVKDLHDELRVATYGVHEKTGKIKIMDKDTMREKLHRSPNYADALCLTFTPTERNKVIALEG